MIRKLAAVAVVVAFAAGAASLARADGDPASDVLYFQDVYLPYAGPSTDVAARLAVTVRAANKAGFRIKVAVIQAEQDLGSVPSLSGRPDIYARFLGAELKAFYSQRLLVVMPAGFGIFDNGMPTTAKKGALAGVAIASSSPDDLTTAATAAVAKLRKTLSIRTRKNSTPPTVKALPSTGTKGGTARLRYTVFDAGGKSRETVRVYGPQYLLFTSISTRTARAKPRRTSTVTWSVPSDLSATKLQFCILAEDPTGNQSRTSWAPLTIS